MSVTGIIVEYNPFHNGHIYHLRKTKNITGCNYTIAVISGNFVQRGEPAVLNKWARTKMGLQAGIDLIIELPFLYCNCSAEGFAFGAVSILNSLGIVDNICFGSESNNIDLLKFIANILVDEPDKYKELLKRNLALGVSYPAARQKSLINYILDRKIINVNPEELDNILKSSNNILAIEYLKSLHRLSSNIKAFSIERKINNYNDTLLTGTISSATAIRNNIQSDLIKNSIPKFSGEILDEEIHMGRGPITLNDFSDMILYKLRHSSISDIGKLADVGEGLEFKIKRASEDCTNLKELIYSIKNKRYTVTRIQRILINSLFNITKDIQVQAKLPVNYIRVLGFNENGRKLLKQIKRCCQLPIITNPSIKDYNLLKFDILATDTYVLGYKKNEHKQAHQDLKIHPIIY